MNEFRTDDRARQTVAVAEIFLKQSARLLEAQAAAARAVMRTQARSIAALGGPDWSSIYTEENEHQFSQFLKTSTDQAVSLVRQTNEAMLQCQEAFRELLTQRTNQLTEQVRSSAEQTAQRTQEVEQQLREAAQQTPKATREAAHELGHEASSAVAPVLHGSSPEQRTRSKRPA